MNYQHQQYYQKVKELVLEYLTPVLVQKLESHAHIILKAKKNLTEYYVQLDQDDNELEVLKMVRKMKTLKESMAQTVNDISLMDNNGDLDEDFDKYFAELQNYTDTLPESLLEYQKYDRFQPFSNDSLRIKFLKRLKKLALKIGWIPRRMANWFRRKTNKSEKELTSWKHAIPLRGMITYHFRDLFVEQLIALVQATNRAITVSSNEIYETEAGLDQKFASLIGAEEPDLAVNSSSDNDSLDEIHSKVVDLARTIPDMTINRLERINETFQTNYEMVDTIELSIKNFEKTGLEATHKQAEKAYKKTMEGWGNTLSVLSDRYNFDHELFNTRFTTLEQYLFMSKKLKTLISGKILGEITQISEFLSERKRQLEVSSIEDADYKKSLIAIRHDISKYLRNAIPTCIQIIKDQKVPALLENLEFKARNQVSRLSDARSMVKDFNYEHAIKESDINKIAPRDLITFEALPAYLNKIQAVNSEFAEVIESTQQHLMEISNICDFNLETALAAIDDSSQHDRAKAMSIEGIERAHGRLQDIIQDLSELAKKGDESIHLGVNEFNGSIMALNEIDKVYETQLRIAKAKAVEKTKALRTEFLNYFRKIIPRLITNLKRRGLMVYKRYRDASMKYGISGTAQQLDAEITGFLSDTDNRVNNMPFVYQRLFEISPLENFFFYEPQQATTLSLRKAYEDWETGHFGATALIAEAGMGASTVIHFFLHELKSPVPVISIRSEQQIYLTEDFFKLFMEIFETDGLNDIDTLTAHLNQLNGKRIIILEDLERLFLRKVNGFDCIRMFVELIIRTNKNIFWLTTINEYSYQYLVKTVNLSDCFSYNIFIKPLKPKQMTSLVLKRHRVSGFNIRFKPHKLDRKNNYFKKMDDEQQQEYLKNEFFDNLNSIVQGNISLALIYWLTSITEVDDDVMHLRSLKGLDFSFLGTLSEEKLFTLHTMVLHDGISIADHARVFQQPVKQSQLTMLLLFDDGIIVHHEDRFYINPLLFRQIVNLLKSKNIFH